MGDPVMAAVGVRNIPEPIRRLEPLAEPDYADVFTLLTSRATDKPAEAWARTLLEHTAIGRSAPRVWRALGLHLGPATSPDHVQGWRIAGRGGDWIRLEAASWLLTAHAVIHVEDGRLSLALFLHYERTIAALIWPLVSLMHRRGVPAMLRQALRADAATERQVGLGSKDER